MFVERKVRNSALFTNLVGWHASAVGFPLSDVTLAQPACPMSDTMFWLHSGITNQSLYIHWTYSQPLFFHNLPMRRKKLERLSLASFSDIQ